MAVHPRACGEHMRLGLRSSFRSGSSPRLRGTCIAHHLTAKIHRFIPAPAGNMIRSRHQKLKTSVHPRACGEHEMYRGSTANCIGSSPRLRGTCQASRRISNRRRFIPAPAGNIAPAAMRLSATSVHPRACGEHGKARGVTAGRVGSSPRLRGTLIRNLYRLRLPRFIPAPAGNMINDKCPSGYLSVHPRACGEHNEESKLFCKLIGSSPRLRGTSFYPT